MHRQLRDDQTVIAAGEQGAQSVVDPSGSRTVSSFVRGSSVSVKYGAMLHRITHWFKPEVILELGTGLGISSVYLASGSPGTTMVTIEGNQKRAEFAAEVIKRCGLKGVKVLCGDLDEKLVAVLPEMKGRFVAFLDGNHRYEPTMDYIKKILPAAGEEALIIMDDIYWSKEMYRAWREIISWPEIRVSIDLYHMGILLLRRDLNKAKMKIRF